LKEPTELRSSYFSSSSITTIAGPFFFPNHRRGWCGVTVCVELEYVIDIHSQTPRQHRPIPFGIFLLLQIKPTTEKYSQSTDFFEFCISRASAESWRTCVAISFCHFYEANSLTIDVMLILYADYDVFIKICFSFFSLGPRNKRTSIFTPKGSPPCCCVNIRWGERDPTAHTEIYPLDKTTDRKKFKRTAWADFYSGRPQRGCTPPPPPILSSAFFLDIFVYQDICGMPCRINGDVSRDARRDIFFFSFFKEKKRHDSSCRFCISIRKVQFAWPTNLINNPSPYA
jgi:hypothetical protein